MYYQSLIEIFYKHSVRMVVLKRRTPESDFFAVMSCSSAESFILVKVFYTRFENRGD